MQVGKHLLPIFYLCLCPFAALSATLTTGTLNVGTLVIGSQCQSNQYLINFDGGVDGQTLTSQAFTNSVNGVSDWYLSNFEEPVTGMTFSTGGQKNLVNPLNNCAAGWITGSGTLGLFAYHSNAPNFNFWFGAPRTRVSAGFWFKHNFDNTNQVVVDVFSIYSTNTGYANFKTLIAPDGKYRMGELEIGGGTSAYGNAAHMTNNTWYWVTVCYNGIDGTNHQINIYNEDLTLLNNIDGFAESGGATITDPAARIIIGMQQAAADSFGVWYDNIKIDDSANAVWPLMP